MVVKAVSVWTWTEAEEAQLSFYEIAIKYSPWFKKIAVVATIKRACERFKVLRETRQTDPDEGKRERARRLKDRQERLRIVNEDRKSQFDFAEREIIKSIQMKAFGEERRELVERGICQPSGGKELSKKRYKLTPHYPYIDQKTGYIRVGGRSFRLSKKKQNFQFCCPRTTKMSNI